MAQHVLWHRFVCFAGILIIAAALLVPAPAEAARRRSLHAGKDVKGITYEEFWARAREEGMKWAGRQLRVRRIISVPVVGFDGRNGRSPVWDVQLVRCDRAQSTDEEEGPSRTCRGRSITVRMVEPGVDGTDPGTHVSKEKHYRGPSIPEERIVISPQRAEETANKHRQYSPAEIDSYSYELRYDHRNDKPLWVIKRTCGYRGKSEGRCRPGDHWIVKVDAESGEVVK
ncbi:MAG: hypothetical protein GYA56_09510 [Geobacteraceae bacterium]|jgi:hypothetical protein|nr:hypothetical protein [Geobacteraceae bacterium]